MLIRVLEIPPASGKFHFDGGEIMHFTEVDWFRDDNMPPMPKEEKRITLASFVRGKRYYRNEQAYLILCEEDSFTINYKAP